MSEQMPSDSEREAPGDFFQTLEATIKRLRAAATPASASPGSWLKKRSSPAAPSSPQSDFNAAVVDAVNQLVSALRETAASQEKRLELLAEELRELRARSEDLDAVRARADGVGSELRAVASNVRGLQERAAALEAELAQARELQGERIQHLLDEQRVCIRQLSLQASEEAVLADRARRATELKLEELARRVPPPPA
jgi:hypothetical protein